MPRWKSQCRVIAEISELERGKMEYKLSGDIKNILKRINVPND